MYENKNKKNNKKDQTIKDVNCFLKIRENSVYVDYENEIYITSKELFVNLVMGDLETKKGEPCHTLSLGKFDENGIDNDSGVFLSVKGKSMYLVLEENKFLISSMFGAKKLITGEWDNMRFGEFQ